jgi:hypothetical protein
MSRFTLQRVETIFILIQVINSFNVCYLLSISLLDKLSSISTYLPDRNSIVKLNFDLNQNSTVITGDTFQGIHFDFSDNNLYIASFNSRSIYIYHTNDEINFNKIANISTEKG